MQLEVPVHELPKDGVLERVEDPEWIQHQKQAAPEPVRSEPARRQRRSRRVIQKALALVTDQAVVLPRAEEDTGKGGGG